jgi:predicted amidohydrolase YtcJ
MPAGPLFGLKGATEHPVEEERLTPQLAIGCYTSRPHTLRAHQRNAGVLEPGRLADFAVLTGNPLGEDLDTVGVRMTILDGEVVFDSSRGAEGDGRKSDAG